MQGIEVVGYVAGIIVAVSLLPQVIKSWKTKSTKDISLLWNSVYVFGLAIWVVYGFGISSFPIIVMMGLEFLFALSLLILKIFYG